MNKDMLIPMVQQALSELHCSIRDRLIADYGDWNNLDWELLSEGELMGLYGEARMLEMANDMRRQHEQAEDRIARMDRRMYEQRIQEIKDEDRKRKAR